MAEDDMADLATNRAGRGGGKGTIMAARGARLPSCADVALSHGLGGLMNKHMVAVLATFAITVGVICKGLVVSGQTLRALFGRGARP